MSGFGKKKALIQFNKELKKLKDFRTRTSDIQVHHFNLTSKALFAQVSRELDKKNLWEGYGNNVYTQIYDACKFAVKDLSNRFEQSLKARVDSKKYDYSIIEGVLTHDSIRLRIGLVKGGTPLSNYGYIYKMWSKVYRKLTERIETIIGAPGMLTGSYTRGGRNVTRSNFLNVIHTDPAVIVGKLNTALDNTFKAVKVSAAQETSIRNYLKELVLDLALQTTNSSGEMLLTIGDQSSNLAHGASLGEIVKQAVKHFNSSKNLKTFLGSVPGSDSIKTIHEKKALKAVVGKIKNTKNVSVNSTSTKPKINKTKVKSKFKQKVKSSNKGLPGGVFRSALTGRFIGAKQARQQQASSLQSPLALVKTLNNQLPRKVRENMGLPSLVNRTGRFSESAKITDIQQTKTGRMSIGYSYQLAPYSVFEQGIGSAPWNTVPERDPRKIIDKSIRELMTQYAVERFTTRRTT
jgi:hypothetical protein